MTSSSQTPLVLAIQPWFADHCFNGTTVLPAVETMALLAVAVAEAHPEIALQVMEEVRFSKFLEIPPGATAMEVILEGTRYADGSLQARLLSRKQLKMATRLTEHGEVRFPLAASLPELTTESPLDPGAADRGEIEIPATRVYAELVPFGPGYHTLQGTLHLSGGKAWGSLRAPTFAAPANLPKSLGSPFPLDGAFHAACVLGQCVVDFVPFPVGLDRRVILRPTQPGGNYLVRVELRGQTRNELVFDLEILDDTGRVHEQVSGIRMRDVSGGRIKPPGWIRNSLTSPPRPGAFPW